MYGVCDVLVGLHYEMESRRFKNTEYENIHYGWETDNGQMSVDFGNDGNSQDDMPFRRQDDEDAPF